MDEPWKHARWKKTVTKGNILYNSICRNRMPSIVKPVETENKSGLPGMGQLVRVTAWKVQCCFRGRWKCSKMDCGDGSTIRWLYKNYWVNSVLREMHLNKAVENAFACFRRKLETPGNHALVECSVNLHFLDFSAETFENLCESCNPRWKSGASRIPGKVSVMLVLISPWDRGSLLAVKKQDPLGFTRLVRWTHFPHRRSQERYPRALGSHPASAWIKFPLLSSDAEWGSTAECQLIFPPGRAAAGLLSPFWTTAGC